MPDSDLIPSLPLDVALLCLLRTPLRRHSLLQQVCRSWHSLFSSPAFYHSRLLLGFADPCACFIQALPHSLPLGPGKSPVYGVSVYDAKLAAWDRLPPIPDFPDGVPLFCQCVSVAGSVILLGGWNPVSWAVLKCVYIFNFSRGQWRRGADMLSVRSFFACGSHGGRIVVAGGHDDSKNALRSAEMYDVDHDVWERLPDMSQERDECKAAVVDGKFLAISGFSTESQGVFGRSAERFDFSTQAWETIDNMWPPTRPPPSSIVAMRGQLYALQEGKLVRYKRREALWEAMAPLPEEVRGASCATVLGDGILVSGLSGRAGPYATVLFRESAGSTAPSPSPSSSPSSSLWQKIEAGDDFCGLVQAACTVQV